MNHASNDANNYHHDRNHPPEYLEHDQPNYPYFMAPSDGQLCIPATEILYNMDTIARSPRFSRPKSAKGKSHKDEEPVVSYKDLVKDRRDKLHKILKYNSINVARENALREKYAFKTLNESTIKSYNTNSSTTKQKTPKESEKDIDSYSSPTRPKSSYNRSELSPRMKYLSSVESHYRQQMEDNDKSSTHKSINTLIENIEAAHRLYRANMCKKLLMIIAAQKFIVSADHARQHFAMLDFFRSSPKLLMTFVMMQRRFRERRRLRLLQENQRLTFVLSQFLKKYIRYFRSKVRDRSVLAIKYFLAYTKDSSTTVLRVLRSYRYKVIKIQRYFKSYVLNTKCRVDALVNSFNKRGLNPAAHRKYAAKLDAHLRGLLQDVVIQARRKFQMRRIEYKMCVRSDQPTFRPVTESMVRSYINITDSTSNNSGKNSKWDPKQAMTGDLEYRMMFESDGKTFIIPQAGEMFTNKAPPSFCLYTSNDLHSNLLIVKISMEKKIRELEADDLKAEAEAQRRLVQLESMKTKSQQRRVLQDVTAYLHQVAVQDETVPNYARARSPVKSPRTRTKPQ